MDDALLKAVEAHRKALQQFVDQGQACRRSSSRARSQTSRRWRIRSSWPSARRWRAPPLSRCRALEASARLAPDPGQRQRTRAAQTAQDLLDQAKLALRGGRASSAKATQAMLDGYAALASGVLIGMSEDCKADLRRRGPRRRLRSGDRAPGGRPWSACQHRADCRMDALILARIQFAANMTFHILFPTISIGMGWALLYFRLRWLKARSGPDGPPRRAGSTPTDSGPRCSR